MDDKKTGSFYTPLSLVELMVEFIGKRFIPNRVLEPSAGDGRFTPYLERISSSITLVEINNNKADFLKEKYGSKHDIVCEDFLDYANNNVACYDLIIGNPPYISKKALSKNQREKCLKITEYFELPDSLNQNIWVSFLLASIKLLEETGAIFYVLPFEFLQVQYAEKMRNFLEDRFNVIEIITFENQVFTGIEQDVCLVFLSNESGVRANIKYKTLVSDSNSSEIFKSIILRNKPLKKWSNCILDDTETDFLFNISNKYPKISRFGEISPGIVTGANSYFIINNDTSLNLGLSRKFVLPILSKSSQITNMLIFSETDFVRMKDSHLSIFLLNLNNIEKNDFPSALMDYIQEGSTKGIDERYKCSIRKRWYDVPIVKSGNISFFKRFSLIPRILVNSTNIHTTDAAYNIRLNDKYDAYSFVFCFYNSLTLALCEYNGRFYGGGVGELVPSEFKNLHIPYKKIDKRNVNRLDRMFRDNIEISKIIDFVDSVVFDLEKNEINKLREIRSRYLKRRIKENKKNG